MRNLPPGYVYERWCEGDIEIEIEAPETIARQMMELYIHIIKQDVPLIEEQHIYQDGRIQTQVRIRKP